MESKMFDGYPHGLTMRKFTEYVIKHEGIVGCNDSFMYKLWRQYVWEHELGFCVAEIYKKKLCEINKKRRGYKNSPF